MAKLRLTEFTYRLPPELIAQYPPPQRTHSRLLVLERDKQKITHRSFKDVVGYFSSGDCLILNNTKVIPARMIGRRQKTHPKLGGGRQELFLLDNLSNYTYRVLARPAKKLSLGKKIFFGQSTIFATVLADQGTTKIIRFSADGNLGDPWRELGEIPLPPYIKRRPHPQDQDRYQTVYARRPGATAAPTAGLHFTKQLLSALQVQGVNIATLTLHVNYGTFAPIKCADITRHKMHREYFILPKRTVSAIVRAKVKGKKVFAVGTTSLRVLETCASIKQGQLLLRASQGWTDLFIYPPYRFKVVDGLLTNFHFPKSTLLLLVSAFAGKGLIFRAYQEAIKKRYRFFSYGDAMLIL